MTPFAEPAVRDRFAGYAPATRRRLEALRELVFEAAAATPGVGSIAETLKWGQPSYLTPETKSGTTIRIDAHPEGGVALYVNCQTTLVETYRANYPDLAYEGSRAVVLPAGGALPRAAIRHLIALALTYHAHKHRRSSA